MSTSRVDRFLDRIDSLPALPGASVRIASMIAGGQVDWAEIETLARNDASLSAAVVRYGNCAAFGGSNRVFDLDECIRRLGARVLMRIALLQSADVLANGGTSFSLPAGGLWRNAVGGAHAAALIAAERDFDPDLAFITCLLRDVGTLVIDRHYGSGYINAVVAQLSGRTFLEAERAAFDLDHAAVGAGLAERWQLPARIVAAIRHHHDPPTAGAGRDPLIDIVHAADLVCLWSGVALGQDGSRPAAVSNIDRDLGMTRLQIERLVDEVLTEVTRLDDALHGKTATAS
jgi:HD-like signal output (HDOD) protein